MASAIVAGVLAGKPGNGGHAWTRVSLVLGLRRLGVDAVLIEQAEAASEEANAYFESICSRFGIVGHLLTGPPSSEVIDLAGEASILLNVGGHLTDSKLKSRPRRRVYIDDDPAYTQLWHEQGLLRDRLAGHDFYFTYGVNIGRRGCTVPTSGIDWRPTLPPVLLDEWPVVANGSDPGFTTVASWRGGYGRVDAGGRLYGQKAHEFRRFIELPARVQQRFEIALDIGSDDAKDVQLLKSHGWCLVDPQAVAASADQFRIYVQSSPAEFSTAQGIYVETQCGWFSDRTTRYLASGKPALVQDTGFSRTVRTGEGLVTFKTLERAVAGAEAIAGDYAAHSQAARALAEEVFDSDKVLGRLMEEAGL